MFGAVVDRHLSVYVYSRQAAHAYEVAFEVWSGAAAEVTSPVMMALTGRFIVITSLRPRCAALDLEVADNLLAFRQADINRVANLEGSDGSRLRAAESVIAKYEEDHPGQVMPKALFRDEMRKYFPGATDAALDRARIAARPAWAHHKGGRPRS
jgi:hypothetical protein